MARAAASELGVHGLSFAAPTATSLPILSDSLDRSFLSSHRSSPDCLYSWRLFPEALGADYRVADAIHHPRQELGQPLNNADILDAFAGAQDLRTIWGMPNPRRDRYDDAESTRGGATEHW